jgi:hypothetical protein
MNFDIDKCQSLWHIDVARYTTAVLQGTGKGIPTMIYEDVAWLVGRRDAQDERNLTHLATIREARIATEYRQRVAQADRSAAPARRVALAAAGTGSSVDLCASCA